MTNGEKLCIDFPNMHYTLSEKQPRRVVTTIGVCASFDLDWWNAEYKEPSSSEIPNKSEIPTSSDDCISRKAALKIYDEWFSTCNIADKKESPKAKINALSPVTPIRPKGDWVYDYTSADGHKTYHCSKCGCYLQPKHSEPLDSFKWCSLCGADMRGEEE